MSVTHVVRNPRFGRPWRIVCPAAFYSVKSIRSDNFSKEFRVRRVLVIFGAAKYSDKLGTESDDFKSAWKNSLYHSPCLTRFQSRTRAELA